MGDYGLPLHFGPGFEGNFTYCGEAPVDHFLDFVVDNELDHSIANPASIKGKPVLIFTPE